MDQYNKLRILTEENNILEYWLGKEIRVSLYGTDYIQGRIVSIDNNSILLHNGCRVKLRLIKYVEDKKVVSIYGIVDKLLYQPKRDLSIEEVTELCLKLNGTIGDNNIEIDNVVYVPGDEVIISTDNSSVYRGKIVSIYNREEVMKIIKENEEILYVFVNVIDNINKIEII